jgi:uncharacterized membrane protein
LEGGAPLIRFFLLLAALIVGVGLVAVHGLRGLVVVAILLLVASAPRTRAWNVAERFLVRLTGSRRRAAVLVMSTVIIILLAFEVYSLLHE